MASGSPNAFMQNFMQGFSFVDDINSRKRRERLLDDALAERKAENEFQRGRQVKADERRDTLFEQSQEDREGRLEDEDRRARGERAALDPNSTDEDLIRDADVSPGAAAEARRRMGEDRFNEAIRNARTIPTAGQATQSQGAGSPNAKGPSLSEAVAQTAVGGTGNTAPGVPSMTDEERRVHDDVFGLSEPASLFQPSQGESSVRQVTEEDINRFDPEFQDKGFAGRFAEGITGNIQQVTGAAGQVLDSFAGGSAPEGSAQRELQRPGPRAAGAALAGDAFVSSEFVTPTELQEIADPEERAAIEARNEEILTQQKARARNPSRNVLARPITRQGAVREGGQMERDDALRHQNRVIRTYTEFLDGTGGKLEAAALNEPSVAAIDYFENRATLQEVWSEDQVAAVDRRMVPVMEAYSEELALEAAAAIPGSAEARQLSARQKNVSASLDIIAGQQPPVAKQADPPIRPPGLKIGDTPRVQGVVNSIYDPDRPAPSAVQPGALNAAVTVAGRISPNKRLNDKQIDALATLAEAGWLDKDTALTVMMTGAWPPGTNPNAIKSIHGRYAITESGGYFVLPDTTTQKPPKPTNIDRTLGEQQFKWAQLGAATADMDESRANQLNGLMLDHAGWIRKHFNTDNQESMMALGRVFGQAVFLSASEHKRMANDGWYKLTNPKDAPTSEELLLNPVMRNKLAAEYDKQPVPMPAGITGGDLDTAQVRASIAEGKVDGIPPEAAGSMSQADLLYVYWVLNATPEDIAAANTQGQ